ncbi:hypothetical protein [Nitrosomonas halophila]|nr:hypothetical protein [Nitrosomonas halophila]
MGWLWGALAHYKTGSGLFLAARAVAGYFGETILALSEAVFG